MGSNFQPTRNESDHKRVTWLGSCTSAGAVVCAATMLGFAGRFWWVFDLFSHFRVQYLLSLLLVIAFTLLNKRFRISGVLGLFAAVNLAYVLPYYVPVNSPCARCGRSAAGHLGQRAHRQ